MKSYDPKKIEKKWQKKWQTSKLYKTPEGGKKPKCYVLDMFPYPSGEGLHAGHVKGYTATDIYARYKRMNGYNVLHPSAFPRKILRLKIKCTRASRSKKILIRSESNVNELDLVMTGSVK